jgi:amino acid adenylation domain-containing protein
VIPESRLLILSAQDEKALVGRFTSLQQALAAGREELADVAFTLATGRRAFSERAAIVLPRGKDPVEALGAMKPAELERGSAKTPADVAMMFPGQGSQFIGMGRELYELHPRFKQILDRVDTLATSRLGLSLRELIFRGQREGKDADALKQTAIAQPALFAIEYALAEVLRGYGVVPSILIGHSIGEYAAACVAGVFELDQALDLVIERGRLMQSMPPGSMLAVRARPEAIIELLASAPELADTVSLAAHNAPELSVVSGPSDAVERFVAFAAERGLESQALHTSHAFHSSMMDPILDAFAQAVARSAPRAPRIPIVSGLTGKPLTDQEACSPEYWANQLRYMVRFSDGVQVMCDRQERVLLECGPGTALMTSAAKQTAGVRPRRMLETLGHPKQDRPAFEATLRCLGKLWLEGVPVDWRAVYDAPSRRLVRLPTYSYTRSRHWMSVARPSPAELTLPPAVANGVAHVNGHAEVSPEVEVVLTPALLARTRLTSVLEARLGRSLAEHELPRSFVELGFDSLALTQLSGKVREEFAVRIPFRRFFEDLGTPVLLAEHLALESKKLVLPSPAPKAARANGRTNPSVNAAALGADTVATSSKALATSALAAPALATLTAPELSALSERLERIERMLEALTRGQSPQNGSGEHPLPEALDATRAPAAFSPARFEPTAAQREIWIASSVGGPSATLAYNECRALAMQGPLDVPALRAALEDLSERHEALRQTFSADGSACITAASRPLALELVDLRSQDEAARQSELEALRAKQTATPFDLVQGPLVRAQLVRLSDESHVLLVCAHHIVVDGYSFGLLTRELAELYSARVERRPHTLGAAESFAAYAAEESAYEKTDVAVADQSFWLEHLKGQSEDLTLPGDAARPAQRTYNSARLDYPLEAALVAKLRELAAASNTSMQTLLMAAFQLVLHAVSRQSDIVLGVPTSGQAAVGLDVLVGHCVHVLPIRVLLDPSQSFGEHARRLNAIMLDGLEHQRTTFSDLLHKLNRPRDPSRIPLIPVAFGMGRSMKRPAFSGLETRLSVVPRISESFELYVYLTEDRDGLEVSWSYNRDLFTPETIAQWQRCFAAVLSALARAGTAQRLGAIDVLDPSDRARLLALARGPSVDHSAHQSVSDRIAERGREQPERTAVIDAFGEHSYRALNARANQLGHLLRKAVSEPNGLVAICLDRSLDLVCALLGCWRAGLGYVPLDPGYPPARIEMILEDAQGPLVLTSRALAERTPERFRRVFIEDLASELAAQPETEPVVLNTPKDVAYVIFTSGSTGRPKGVVIQQGPFENFIVSMQREPGFTADDRLLAITTISFDIAGLELFLPLATGGSLVLATREQAGDPRELSALLAKHRISVLQATPASWNMLFDTGWPGQPDLKVLCGGEAFPRHLAEKFLESCGEIWNVYGPTETTVWSTAKLIMDAGSVTIGKPIDNTNLYVLDEQRALVPAGSTGELWIGGSGVAQGYLGRADLTSERFVQSPFDPSDRIYKTGDLARVRNDGEFECLGRADFQVKIRGFRIELGEIESAILKCPGVAAAVVVAREDRPGDKTLVGYVVALPGASIDVEAVRSSVAGQLPAYMVPSALCVLDALPMTPNNKVDRKALPPPVVSDGYKPPELARRASDQLLSQEVWVDVPIGGEPLAPVTWLILVDDLGIGRAVAEQLESRSHVVTIVHSRDRYHELSENEYAVNPELGREELDRLSKRLDELGRSPDRIVHLWLLGEEGSYRPGSSSYHRNQEHGLYSVLHLAGAHARHAASKAVVHHVVGSKLFAEELTAEQRERTTILGACRVVPNELPRQQVRALDLGLEEAGKTGRTRRALADRLLRELLEGDAEPEVRYRQGVRQVPSWRSRRPEAERLPLPQGSALIVGLTEVGLASARVLARAPGVKVAVIHDPIASSDEQRDALSRLEQSGVVAARFVTDTTNQAELKPIIERIRSEHGPIRTLVLATSDAAPMPLRHMTEADVEARVVAKLHSLLALESVLPPEQLELTVVHASLDARLGAPAYLADATATAFVEKRLVQSKGRRVVCQWGPLRSSADAASSATSHVERDRDHFRRAGLAGEELLAALVSAFGSGNATLAISPFELGAYRARLMLSSAKDSGEGSRRVFVEPTTDTERRLARLWKEALRLDRVSTRDSFFDLGGHSLLAARLFAKLHSDFGVALPLSVLLEAPTIESLAVRIDGAREPGTAAAAAQPTGPSLLVRLNTGSDPRQAPLFVVGGAMGNVLNLRHLARICDPRRDFYGIQARGLAGEAEPHRSLIEAAKTYVEEVRRVQPHGPYYLGGFCIGGVAALEMAQLLKAEGEEVAMLAMLDSHLPEVRGHLSLADRSQIQYERLREGGADYVRDWVHGKYVYSMKQWRRRLGLSNDDPNDPTQYRSQQVSEAIMYARSVYEPRFYDGHVVVFRPPLAPKHHLSGGRMIDDGRSFLKEDNGWRRMVRSLSVYELACPPGEHDGFVLEPYVRDLARRLREFLPV